MDDRNVVLRVDTSPADGSPGVIYSRMYARAGDLTAMLGQPPRDDDERFLTLDTDCHGERPEGRGIWFAAEDLKVQMRYCAVGDYLPDGQWPRPFLIEDEAHPGPARYAIVRVPMPRGQCEVLCTLDHAPDQREEGYWRVKR